MSNAVDIVDLSAEIDDLYMQAYGMPPLRDICMFEQFPDMGPEYEPCVVCMLINGGYASNDALLATVRRHHVCARS